MYAETLKCGCVYAVAGVTRCAAHEREMIEATQRWTAQRIARFPDTEYTAEYRARAGAAGDLI